MLINICWINLFEISRECDHHCISIDIGIQRWIGCLKKIKKVVSYRSIK